MAFWKRDKTGSQPSSFANRASLIQALEPRMMFDASVPVVADQGAQAVEAASVKDTASSHDAATLETTATAESSSPSSRHEVVFVDGNVADLQQLTNQLAGKEVVVLDPSRDGLQQMADYLKGRSEIDAIHLISHGGEGSIQAGSSRLTLDNIDSAQAKLESIGASLSVDGDLLIYGCDVGKGQGGSALLAKVADYTDADVSASTDWSGDASKGADWVLEASTGSIETASVLDGVSYDHVLNTLNAGDIVVLGWSALNDTITFATLVDIPAGTQIKISDRGWDQSTGAFVNNSTGDGVVVWTTSSTVSAGSVFNLYLGGSDAPTTLTNVTAAADLSSDITKTGYTVADPILINGDGVFIYQDFDANPYFIFGMNNSAGTLDANNWNTSIAILLRDSMLPDGTGSQNALTNGANAVGLPGGALDNIQYTGPTGAADRATWLARVTNAANWAGDNTGVATTSVGSSVTLGAVPALVSATFGDSTLSAGETTQVTFVFNTGVIGFTTADITAPNGVVSGLGSTDGGVTWTGTFTPSAGVSDPTNAITVNLAGVLSVAGSLPGSGTADSANYVVDTVLPTVTSVTSSTVNGTYKTGDVISIQVSFNEAVTVTGTPQLTLETGAIDRVINYSSGSGSNTLTFNYTVQAGETNADLDYLSTGALALNGGTIRDAATNNATLTLASPGAAGSLGANKNIVIDSAPSIGNVNGESVDWAGVGNTVTLDSDNNAVISDTEKGALNGGNGNWAGASLTVQRSGTAVTTDTFGFNTSGALFTVSGSDLQSGGQTFATFTSAGGVLTITFTSSGTTATTALINDVAQRVTYRSDTPAGDAIIQFTLSDGTSTATADVTVTSDTIYVTNTSDTATIGASDGVGLREAVAIAAADATGTQTIILGSGVAGQTITLGSGLSLGESLSFNGDSATGLIITGSTITLGGGTTTGFTNASGSVSFNSTLAGTGALAKSGAGTLTLGSTSNNGGWSGAMSVTGGTLNADTGSRLSSGNLTLDGGTLAMTVTGAAGTTTTVANAVTLGAGGGTISVGGGGGTNIADFSGVISGSGSLTKTAAAILQLSGSNNYAGTTTVNSGTLSVSSDGNLGSGAVTLNSGTTLSVTGPTTIDNAINLNGDATVSNAGSLTLSGTISGGGSLTKSGSSTLTLSGTNGYLGTTTVSAGNLRIAGDGNLGGGSVSLSGGTVLTMTGATNIDNDIVLGGNAFLFNADAVTLSGVISGSGGFSKSGGGALTFSGTNAYLGTTTVNSGTLIVASDANLGGGALGLATGTALSITGNTTIDNAIDLSGTASLATSAAATLSGVISGSGGLTKTGTGTLTLSGTNNYTGATTVSAGTLAVNGSTTSATTVASGGTLAGSGTLGGAVTIQSGGILSPGNSGAGALTINGNLGMATGSTLAVDINGTTAGTGFDQLVVTGTVDVSGATLAVNHGYAPGNGDTYTIISNDAADAVTGTFSGLAEGATTTAGGNSTVLTASYIGGTGNDFTLTAPINAAPVVGSLNGDSITFTQGSGTVLLDGGSNATVIDSDSPDFDGGNVTVSIVTNGVAGEDVLGIRNQGTGAGQIGVSGSNVTYQGTIIGSFTGGSAGADLVISLNSSADAVAVQALIRNLSYNNTNVTNGIGQADRTVRITVNDGDGATSSNADVTVAVVETVAPATVSIVVADTALSAGETSTVTLSFSEAVTGLTTADFTVANGVLSNLSTSDGGITWTATLTPDSNVQDAANLITLNNTGYTDLAGNAGVGTTDSNNYAIDTQRPTATIVVADTALKAGETSTVTITFSEAVNGLTTADFTVANGTLSSLSSSNGGITWTATLTPDTDVQDAGNLITLDNTGYIDQAGNTGSGTTNSNNYAIDTQRPNATIVVADTSLIVGETTTVTITFNEAVTGLDLADFTVANGSLSNLSSTDGGTTWTATLTPSASVEDSGNLISLDNTGVIDAAGNTGIGSTDSNNYAVDTQAPLNAVPGAQVTNTVTPIVFSSGNGNALTVTEGGNLTTVVSVASGTLSATAGGGAIISNNGTGSVTISGTAAEINAALEGLVYTPAAAGGTSISIQSTDAAGNIDSDSVAVTVNNSTLLVTSNLDSGDDQTVSSNMAADQADGGGLSIREALFWARGGDTITFDLNGALAGNQGGTIVLGGSQLDINYSNLRLDGDLNDDGVADVTLSANGASRVMQVGNSLAGVEISGLVLTQGNTGGGGAGLSIGFGSSVTLRDSVVSNSADSGLGGGGIYGSGANLTMVNSTVSGNTSNTFGGGIRVVGSGGTLTMLNSTVTGNTTTGAGAHGGGLQFGGTGGLTIINSTFSGNAALGAGSLGGGIRVTSGTSFIYNTTVVGNAASGSGGGIHANGTDTLVNTVVAGNTSGAGAAAAIGGSPLATGGIADDVDSTVETATNSYFGSNVGITTASGVLNNQGTANLLLGNLANNGGSVQTHKPQAGSALLDAGSNAGLPLDTYDLDDDGNTTEVLPIDAIGNVRATGSAVDIGAVEANAPPVLGNVNGGGSYPEGGAAIVIDADASVSDADLDLLNGGSGNYDGASLVVVRNGGANASDLFGFLDGNGITLVGSSLVKNGQVIGSFDTSTSGQLTLTFTDANGQIPTTADVNHILQQLTYANSSNDPVASVALSWTFADELGATAFGSTLVNLVAVNNAPTATATGGNPTYTENGAAVDLFSGISIGTVEAGQSITGLTLTVSNLANGASEILSIDGTDVLLVNGASGTTASNGIGYSVSLVGGTATVTLTHAGLSTASAQGVIDGMTYRNSSEAPAAGSRVVTLTSIRDSGGTSNGGVDTSSLAIAATVNVVAVNDAPVITAPGSIGVTEDLAQALTGISFSDVDASTGSVTVTFSVASGSLGAISGSGVTVAGSGTGTLTLVGSISDINAFIAANGVSFTAAANATANVTLTIGIDDGGNTGTDPGNSGTGTSEASSTTVTLAVSAVNDAPVNSLPVGQGVNQDANLVFSAGNGNLISISDVDVGGGTLQVTLTATNGLISLSGISGLSFSNGDGTADGSMTFTGTLADINNALNGLTFSPTTGYNGPASIQISTSDLGGTGSGGAQTDTDTLAITVNPINPVITDIGVSNPDGGYKVGDVITITVTFDQAVIVDTSGGVPTLLLETGLLDRTVTYVSGSGSNTLSFSYTVQAGDLSADLDYQSSGALALNGGSIRNAGNASAILTLPTTGGADSIAGQHGIVIDGVVPQVTGVSVPANGTYVAGQNLDFTVNLSEAVTVDTTGGTPRIAITLDGGGTVFADYLSGSGTTALVFRLTVASGQLDTNGISVGGTIQANGGTLRDGVGNDANTSLNNVASTTGVRVDAVVPVVGSVSVPVGIPYNAGDTLTFVVNASEAVIVNGVPRLSLDIGGTTVFANYVAGSGTSTLVFQYTIQAGDNDANGIAVTGLASNGGSLLDAAGNAMTLTLSSVGDTSGVIVDTVAPNPSGIVSVDPSPTNAGSVRYTVTFSEDVSGVDLGDFTLVTTGSAGGSLTGLVQIDARTYQLTVSGVSGTGTLGLNLNGSGTGIVDVAGNALSGGLTGAVYSVDRDVPTVTGVSVPVGVHYNAGDTLTFVVNASEAVIVNGVPRLAIDMGGTTVFADYVAGSGSSTLVFQYTVRAGDNDANGIAVTGLVANGATLRDAIGNSMNLALNGVGNTSGVIVDTTAPNASATVTPLPTPGSVQYTVTFDENVSGIDLGDFNLVTTGNVSGTLQSLVQVDSRTFLVTVSNVAGAGTLSLGLNATGTLITDTAGNAMLSGLPAQTYSVPQNDGDPEFRANPPVIVPPEPTVPVDTVLPNPPPPPFTSPLIPPPLFEQPTLGSGIPTLGNIFINQGALAPSFIAQVFGSSDGFGDGSGSGFLGFGGGDGGVFGSSSLSSFFDKDVPQDSEEMKLFDGKQWKGGSGGSGQGIFGAPSLGQQLQDIKDNEQRQVRELAMALGQIQVDRPQA
ncbi:Ig-like domain-containing protein [Pseudomonas resinovorans]|uniref:Ig-like domain-containing protein n=1 Tax=Metapseudomonas resinovorans TaxID=53412 RepID=UPI00237F0E4C|nr:Ig-like domain-containing protein [Pseudomonas resinovorans]MDE3739996.1 Ig-like domain-containing protein [Pseudomonas resinovorans]